MAQGRATLRELAGQYYCDKLYAHSYIDAYEELLSGRNVRRLLEIGIGNQELMRPLVPKYVHGASLKMWADYFPDADIYACDIRDDVLVNEGRIHSTVCDQYDYLRLQVAFGTYTYDVIIDDGCHHPMAQVISFAALWPLLNKGGIYIIEDVGYPELISKAIDGDAHIFRKDGRWDDVLVTKHK